MSLLNKASLIQIPSGYKDGTLYSAKPTNGDGDFTFSRGSNLAATRINSDGLIEKGRENLLLQSNQFDVYWTGSGSWTATSNQSGYDGSNDAWLLADADATGNSFRKNISNTGVLTFSAYFKAGSIDGVRIRIIASPSNVDTWWNLADSSTEPYSQVSGIIDRKKEILTNGWVRLSITFNATSTSSIRLYSDDGSTKSYAIGNFYIQDAQLEAGLVATDYIETGASTAQAGILEDMPRLDYSGGASCPSLLLEPQRTNVVTNSEYIDSWTKVNGPTITTNIATSPDGSVTADGIQDTDGTNFKRVSQSFSVSANSTYSVSIFVKKETSETNYGGLSFDFTGGTRKLAYIIVDAVNGTAINSTSSSLSATTDVVDYGEYWRIISTTTDNGSNTTLTFSYYATLSTTPSGGASLGVGSVRTIWGAQVEAGSYPTSYIPTYGGSSVTRSFDELDLTNWVSKGIISDSNEWTIFYEVDGLSSDYDISASQWLPGDDNTIDVYMRAGATNENFARFYWRKDSKYIGSTYGKKIIARLSGGTGTTFADGVEIASSSISGDYSNIGLNMGSSSAAGYIKQAIIFPTALTDAECIELTTL